MDADYLRGANEVEFDEGLIARNLKWMPKINQYLSELEGNIIIAVGVDHLRGKSGLLDLLDLLRK